MLVQCGRPSQGGSRKPLLKIRTPSHSWTRQIGVGWKMVSVAPETCARMAVPSSSVANTASSPHQATKEGALSSCIEARRLDGEIMEPSQSRPESKAMATLSWSGDKTTKVITDWLPGLGSGCTSSTDISLWERRRRSRPLPTSSLH